MNRGVLDQLGSHAKRWLTLRAVLAAFTGAGVLALALALADAAVDLSEGIRLATPWVLAAAAVALFAIQFAESRRLSQARLARSLEQNDATLGNRLINAVQLADITAATPPAEFLRREAIELGRQVAATQNAWRLIGGRVRRAAAGVAAVVIAGLALLLFAGDLVRAVWPRFLDPHGDHPPYSRLKIEVAPGAATVIYGGQIELRARTSGRPVDKLWLVTRSGTNETRAAMFLAPDKTFFQTLVNLREPADYFVTDGAARSRRFPIAIRYTPQITSVEMTQTFPDYTGRPVRMMKLTDEVQALPEGTAVQFRLVSNRPLQSGALELTPVLGGKAMRIALRPGAQNTLVTGSFTLSEPVVFNLSVRDVGGLDSNEPRRGRLNVLPDRPPKVFVTEPGRDAVATPAIRIPVRVQASDDYGVSRIVWLRGFNRSVERPFSMKVTFNGGPQSAESVGAFDLDKLGVRAGDVIEYYFEAADNYPKGPNVAFSRAFRLEIISPEQYEAILRREAARKALFEPYFKLDAWLRRLAERARTLEAAANRADPAARAAAEALQKELEQFQAEMGKLMQAAVVFDIERTFAATLVTQHTGVSEAAGALKRALAASGSLSTQTLGDISRRLTDLAQAEDEQVEQPARQIVSVVRVVAKADAFVKLTQQQQALARMLRRFSEKSGALSRLEQMELQELTHQQERIRDALRQMLVELPDLAAQLPPDAAYDPLRGDVRNFLAAVAEAKIEQDLGDAAGALNEPDAVTGYILAQQAAGKMDRLVAKCEGMPGEAAECLAARFQPTLRQPGLGNTLEQILAALGVGTGESGRDGYGLFNEAVALYGPNVPVSGEQAGGRGQPAGSQAPRVAQVAGNADDSALPPPETPGGVRLQTDAKFPLRYRELVGEYFRVVAESEREGAK